MRTFLNYEIHSREWGEIRLSRIIPVGNDIWGHAVPIKDTPWGKGVVTVSGENLSHALHGHVVPLIRSLGVPPHIHLRRIPDGWRTCEMSQGCLNFDPSKCHPCLELPDCYSPPGMCPTAQLLAAQVALAWRDGRYVFVVDGEEFAL